MTREVAGNDKMATMSKKRLTFSGSITARTEANNKTKLIERQILEENID